MGYTLKDPVRKMKKATRFVGDSSHENLMRVHLAADGSIQSTDAYQAFRMEKGWSGGSDVDIPADIAKRMSRCKVGGNGTAEITQRDGSVAVKMGDGSEFVGECNFRWGFPKLDHFFEPKTQTTVRVLKSDLLEAARGYKRLKAEKMLFEVKGGRFLTRAYGDGWDGKRDFPNAEVEGRDIAIGFNPKFIVDALNSMGDELTVEIEDSFKPSVIRDAALWEELSVSVVTMPIRLGAKDYEVMKDEKKEKKMETEIKVTTARVDFTPEGVKATPVESHVEKVWHPSVKGTTFCFTGALKTMTRDMAKARVKELGGFTRDNLSKKVDVLVVSDHAMDNMNTSKMRKAEKYGIRTITETKFMTALREAELERAAKAKAGAEVKATVTEHADVTAVTFEPPKTPKRAPKPEVEKPTVKAPKVEETAAVEITVDLIRSKFEGEGIAVNQAREGACIWVNGSGAKGRKDELKEMGFKYGKSRKFGKGWWVKPQA